MRVSAKSIPLAATLCLTGMVTAGCDWQGANSLPLPGTEGSGEGAYSVAIEMPNVTSIQRNSRVRVNDVTVGNVTDIRLDGWHAVVTVSLNPGVSLPRNATAKIGQTSLLGSLHVELTPPLNEQAEGRLQPGDTISLDHASQYPTTEQTLASVSTVLTGGGLGQIQEIDKELNAALNGHEGDVRSFLTRLDTFTADLNNQKSDIIAALEGLDRLAATVGEQNEVLTTALTRIPPAIEVLNQQKEKLSTALVSIGNFADVTNTVTTTSAADIESNLRDLESTIRALGDAGPSLTGALGILPTFPWPLEGVHKFVRGDAVNLSAAVDLTLGRLDRNFLQGTPLEGSLHNAETALGRTLGRIPPPSTKNPLTAPLDTVAIRGTR
ncbi:MCE family protein [Rhodococcus sp. NPDC127530]|uniref:MCE family protein n=1 Tax=unclassified Rhodococcus (in: high G+C Gram-positive bacteria) TaxID=192944 RepID=UPI003630A75A